VLDKILYEVKNNAGATKPQSIAGVTLKLCHGISDVLDPNDTTSGCIATVVHQRTLEILLLLQRQKDSMAVLSSLTKTVSNLNLAVGVVRRQTLELCHDLLKVLVKAAAYMQRRNAQANKNKSVDREIVRVLSDSVLSMKQVCRDDGWTDITLLQTLVQCVAGVLDMFKDKERAANSHLSSSISLYADRVQIVLLDIYGVLAELYGIELKLR